jgi:hypothetical protein
VVAGKPLHGFGIIANRLSLIGSRQLFHHGKKLETN